MGDITPLFPETEPFTITLEITVAASGSGDAHDLGSEMLDYIVSGWDGAAGAVVKVQVASDGVTDISKSGAEFAMAESARRLHYFCQQDPPVTIIAMHEALMLEQRIAYWLSLNDQEDIAKIKAGFTSPNWPYGPHRELDPLTPEEEAEMEEWERENPVEDPDA